MVADGGAPSPVSLSDALARLYARATFGIKLGLDAMRAACDRAGHPERAFDAVHVAGTNGKGSTCAMVAASARAAGLRTGLYTSPHLCTFAERIQVDGAPLDERDLALALDRALRLAPEATFFEVATLAAFIAFRDAGVELAVVEAGLGGRLDATNVLESPRCTAVTSVGLDHTEQLGGTRELIAIEKAHIAKQGAPMVLGADLADVRGAIEGVTRTVGVAPLAVDDADALPRLLPELGSAMGAPPLTLRGAHQVHNARVADLLASTLGFAPEARRRGLSDARWPGRLEIVRDEVGAEVLLDGAHNADGAEALARALAQGTWRSPAEPLPVASTAIVFGALLDKDAAAMLDVLAPRAARMFFVAPSARAAHAPDALAQLAAGVPCHDVATARAAARRVVGPRGLVVICGSLYLVGEARAQLLGLARDPIVAL